MVEVQRHNKVWTMKGVHASPFLGSNKTIYKVHLFNLEYIIDELSSNNYNLSITMLW